MTKQAVIAGCFVFAITAWTTCFPPTSVLGLNLKFNDILASIGLVQLGKLEAKPPRKFYSAYKAFSPEFPHAPPARGRLAAMSPLWVGCFAPAGKSSASSRPAA